MLIDDDEDDNFFHRLVLVESAATSHIQVAQTGFEALEYLSGDNETPDLIFLDINMPGMNGWEFLDAYSKIPLRGKTRPVIVMLTTSANPADRIKAKNIYKTAGFETKPLTAGALEVILNTHFADR